MNVLHAAAAALALVATLPVRANLLVDGGFESPAIAYGSYATYASLPGWTGAPNIEVQNHVAGSPYEGAQFVELDTSANSAMAQSFASVAGATYRIAFRYSPRPGVAAASNGIEFLWNGVVLATLASNGVGLSDTLWTGYDFTAVASGARSRVGFAAVGTSDSLGGYLDDVVVTAVPEPGVIGLLALGAVLAWARPRRRHDERCPAARSRSR